MILNALGELAEIVKNYNSIFLVTGKSSYSACGAEEALGSLLKNNRVIRFSDFRVNPKLEDVKRGIALFRDGKFDLIIAVGGGTVIDTAKLIKTLAVQKGRPESYIRAERSVETSSIPLVAVPTTSGSGSEATHFAVVYIGGKKYSLAHQSLLPEHIVLDPELTMTLSPYMTACTGLDALCQGVESFWSVNSTAESREDSRKAVKKVLDNLIPAVREPNQANRREMAEAAYLAGRSINITKTTAPHAFSYFMTSRYGLAHGHAAALTLGQFIRWNYPDEGKELSDKRGRDFLKDIMDEVLSLFGAASAEEAAENVYALIENCGLDNRLESVGFKDSEEIGLFFDSVNLERLANNPVRIDARAIRKLLFPGSI